MTAALAFLRGLPWRAIVMAALLAFAGIKLYGAGVQHERAIWLAKQAKQQAADAAQTQAQLKEDNQFVAKAVSQQAQLQANYAQLERQKNAVKKQIKIIAPKPAAQLAAPASGPSAVQCPESGSVPGVQPDADPVLSLGAVWLWNSALSGTSTAAGACQFDAATGQASAACADGSGLSLEAAWDNQAVNAQSCALDRANHQRLIDFIHQREKGTAP
jgi:hypothetical protein